MRCGLQICREKSQRQRLKLAWLEHKVTKEANVITSLKAECPHVRHTKNGVHERAFLQRRLAALHVVLGG